MSKALRLINRLLGILSFEDIENLTTISEGKEKVPLTQLISDQFIAHTADHLHDTMAKILPFEPVPSSSDAVPKEEKTGDSQRVEASSSIEESTSVPTEEIEKGKMGTTVFILSQRKKFEPNHKKLKAKEVMNSYLRNASIDINEERKLKEDLRQSSNSGILVNKRQF